MDGWQTKVVPFVGGLVTNQSPYQQGFNNAGSARILINYEPSVKGGYRRINGYTKVVADKVPAHAFARVQGSGQTGSTLYVGGIFTAPAPGDTITVEGVAGEYVIISATETAGGEYEYALTLNGSLASSPADKAAVTFTQCAEIINGIKVFNRDVLAVRTGVLYKNAGELSTSTVSADGWTPISTPNVGSVVVSGASQTGTTLTISGVAASDFPRDTIIEIAGVEKTYFVGESVDNGSGVYTLDIHPALDSSPADGAAVNIVAFNVSDYHQADDYHELRDVHYTLGSTDYTIIANGTTYPMKYTSDGEFEVITSIPDEVRYSNVVAYYKTALFLARNDKIVFSAPSNPADFTPANGGGVISVNAPIVNMIVFRDQLIIFTKDNIQVLTGTTIADFVLKPITTDLGCIKSDTIREVGGDIMFLAPDGLRMLGATDRIGDFNLDPVAANIQNAVTNLVNTVPNTRISSIVLRKKKQYRIFGTGGSLINGKGLLGANLLSPEGGAYWAWGELKNLHVIYADSSVHEGDEIAIFSNDTGYVYYMDNSNAFDGQPIQATYATPFIPFDDPELRKTMHKLFVYVDPEGAVDITNSLKFDFNDPDAVLPSSKTISLSNSATAPASYGTLVAQYGVARYGGSLRAVFKTQLVGSAFSVSFFFQSNDTNPPYTLDTMTVEYAIRGRR